MVSIDAYHRAASAGAQSKSVSLRIHYSGPLSLLAVYRILQPDRALARSVNAPKPLAVSAVIVRHYFRVRRQHDFAEPCLA